MSINPPSLNPNDRVRVSGRYELGIGEILRVSETGGLYVADVVFESRAGRRLRSHGRQDSVRPHRRQSQRRRRAAVSSGGESGIRTLGTA